MAHFTSPGGCPEIDLSDFELGVRNAHFCCALEWIHKHKYKDVPPIPLGGTVEMKGILGTYSWKRCGICSMRIKETKRRK
ncbi:MAG: hypothetical protein ACXABY_00680 [Candidatus Thorarchaeota archaeon]|jgi:hypothetical protein